MGVEEERGREVVEALVVLSPEQAERVTRVHGENLPEVLEGVIQKVQPTARVLDVKVEPTPK
jgi:hypothetical protein